MSINRFERTREKTARRSSSALGSVVNEDDQERVLQSQLAMTPQTWAQMRSLGVTEATLLEVELFFFAALETQARSLAEDLAGRLRCDASVRSDDGKFSVVAVLPAQTFSEESLLDLTREMCDLGARYEAEFDGWGAPVPAPTGQRKPWWKFW